jgi:hypothetical protein
MARTNKISATLTEAEKTAIIAKINEATALMPFLINLTVEERKRLKGIGNKNLSYVNKCLEGAIAFPDELKVSFDTPEFKKDVNLFNALLGIQIAVQSLFEKVDDTMKAAGIDSMGSASEVYDSLKSSAKSNASVKTIVDEIAVRFEAQKKPRAKKTV